MQKQPTDTTFSASAVAPSLPTDYIAVLRFPLSLGVVFIHCIGTAPQWNTAADLTPLGWAKLLLASSLPSVAVPCFFLISGFLFFRAWTTSFDRKTYVRQLSRRVQSLLLPYLLWNILAWCDRWLRSGRTFVKQWHALEGWNFLWGEHAIGSNTTAWWGGRLEHLAAPADVPLWFVRDLMLLVLIAPVLHWFLRRRVRWYYLSALYLLLVTKSLPYAFGCSPKSLFFFSLGAALSLSDIDMQRQLYPHRYGIAATAILLLAAQIFGKGHDHFLQREVVSQLLTFSLIATYIVGAMWLSARGGWLFERLKKLASSSFFLYAAHTVGVLHLVDAQLKKLLTGSDEITLLLRFLLLPILSSAVCVALFYALRRLIPRWAPLLTGEGGRRS